MDKHLENSFDQFIRDSLRDVQIPYDGSSWETMQEKLIAAESAELTEVDEVAKDALHNYSVPYESSTWALLSDRLDQIEYNRRLIGLKVIEAAIFILAVLTIVRFMAQLPDTSEGAAPPAMALSELAKTDNLDLATATIGGEQGIQKTEDAASIGEVVQSQNRVLRSSKRYVSHHEMHKSGITRVALPVLQPGQFKVLSTSFYPVRSFDGNAVIALQNLPFEEVSEMSPAALDGLEPNDGMVAWYAMNKKKVETTIGVFSEMNMHDIQAGTPLPNFGSIHSQAIVNPAFGVMTNVQFGKFGFDFGLGYEEVRYHSVLDFNEVHKVHIPFHLRFTPVDTRLFNLYAKAGVAVHGAMYAKYQTPPLSAAPGFSSRKEARFNDGLLRGGTVESNVYTTRSVGIGIESPISKDFSIFGEGLHQSHLGGALSTTTSDRFKTISVRLGFNYKFK